MLVSRESGTMRRVDVLIRPFRRGGSFGFSMTLRADGVCCQGSEHFESVSVVIAKNYREQANRIKMYSNQSRRKFDLFPRAEKICI